MFGHTVSQPLFEPASASPSPTSQVYNLCSVVIRLVFLQSKPLMLRKVSVPNPSLVTNIVLCC